jgi:hypothetical protein
MLVAPDKDTPHIFTNYGVVLMLFEPWPQCIIQVLELSTELKREVSFTVQNVCINWREGASTNVLA